MKFIRPAIMASFLAAPLSAGEIDFSSGWNEQKLSLFSSNDYAFGETLEIGSDGTVSIAWTRLPQEEWSARSASWDWSVSEGTPPTDLSVKGGDDRDISVYFVFVPEARAQELMEANIRSLLGDEDVRVLQYIWGGSNEVGSVFASPYQPEQGANVILHGSGTGEASEEVDLSADFREAFGEDPGALVGLAISADSDDTETSIRATVSDMMLN